jgi:hypothetical protein
MHALLGEPLLCGPCTDFPPRHHECQPIPWCSCWVEVLIEAEAIPNQRAD